jgi:hypothetical protein
LQGIKAKKDQPRHLSPRGVNAKNATFVVKFVFFPEIDHLSSSSFNHMLRDA